MECYMIPDIPYRKMQRTILIFVQTKNLIRNIRIDEDDETLGILMLQGHD
jgi:hypothetical protein